MFPVVITAYAPVLVRAGKVSTLVDRENSWMEEGTEVERLVFFSDAVFAIAITLLALEIRLPELHHPDIKAMAEALVDVLPEFFGFFISFWIISMYWMAHHRLFGYLRAFDRRLLVLNLLFLMWIVLMPFSASLLGRYGSNQLALDVYFSHMIVTSFSLGLVWWYMVGDRRLVSPDLDRVVIRYNTARILILPTVFFLGIFISFFSTAAAGFSALVLFLVRPVTSWYARRQTS